MPEENQVPSKAAEIIRLISNAEAEAEAKIRKAEAQAKEILADADKTISDYRIEKENETDEKIIRIRTLTDEKSAERSSDISNSIAEKCEKMKSDARANKGSAVAAAVERILKEWRL